MRVGYFDLGSGASGDMFLGALLGALDCDQNRTDAAPLRRIERLLDLWPGARMVLTPVTRCGEPALKVDFWQGEIHADQSSGSVVSSRHLGHVTLGDIRELLSLCESRELLSPKEAHLAYEVFSVLAQAEAICHGLNPDKVAFHEVGEFDSLMDVLGFCVLVETLGLESVVASPSPLGYGVVECAHGILTIPVPAVRAIVDNYSLPCSSKEFSGECLTPTAAAILAVKVDSWGESPEFSKVIGRGVGAGTRDDPDRPNVLRLTCGVCA